jgi:predicted deacylase
MRMEGGVAWFEAALRTRVERRTGYLPVGTRPDGTAIGLPVIVVTGVEAGPVIAVDGCVHGDEYEGCEAVIRVARALDPAALRGTFIGVPALNPAAFQDGMRIHASDQKYMAFTRGDMNRIFPGDPRGHLVERLAHAYWEQVVRRADAVISFHGGGNMGAIGPFVVYSAEVRGSRFDALALAQSFGTEFLWRVGIAPGVLLYETTRLGIPCLSPEVGGEALRYPTRDASLGIATRGIRNVMRAMGMLAGPPEGPLPARHRVVDIDYLKSNAGGLFTAAVGLGAEVKAGGVLGEVMDIFGNTVDQPTAPRAGVICGLRTSPRVQTGDWLFMLGHDIAAE